MIVIIGTLSVQGRSIIDLPCQFVNDRYYGYTCFTEFILFDNDTEISTIFGKHKSGKTDDDVLGFRVDRSNFYDVPYKILKQFKYLDILNVSFSSIEHLSPLKNCENLRKLMLTNNLITESNANTFKICSKMEELWLQDNKLKNIDELTFSGLANLKVLYLFNNDIEFFQSDTFKPLVNLEQLWLNNIKILFLNPKWFDGLEKVSGLSLFGNQISSLKSNTFKSLNGLERIDFDYDAIERLSGNLFTKNIVIKEISLRFNKIQAIERNFFKKILKTLKLVDLRGNICVNEDFRIDSHVDVKNMMKKLEICFSNYENGQM